ncbi:hypothetical protein MP638_005580 [Amoeboaphelidium occidentale]|nr:hypothetical protein MP638_005580 [Amoeboaphelidium occidentale]
MLYLLTRGSISPMEDVKGRYDTIASPADTELYLSSLFVAVDGDCGDVACFKVSCDKERHNFRQRIVGQEIVIKS